MMQIFGLTDPSDIIAAAAVVSTLIIAVGGTVAQFRLASGQKKTRLADFENEILRELRGHIAHILESSVRKLALRHKLDAIAPQGLSPNIHATVIDEYVRTARDLDDTVSSAGNAFEQIRLILIEPSDENVVLIAQIGKLLDAKTNGDLESIPIVPLARTVIENKLNNIRDHL